MEDNSKRLSETLEAIKENCRLLQEVLDENKRLFRFIFWKK